MKFSILNNFNILICYFILMGSIAYAKKVVLFNKMNCSANPDYFVYTKCEVTKNDASPHGLATLEFDLIKKIEKLYVHIDSFRLTNGEYKPFIFKFDLELCSIMEKGMKGTDIFSQFIHKMSTKIDSNGFHKCPFEGHLYFRNMSFDPSDFPIVEPFLQTGSFRMTANYYHDKEKTNSVATTEMYVQVKDK